MIKLLKKIPPMFIALIFVLIIPLTLVYTSTNSFKDLYFKHSLERLELCFKRNQEANLPIKTCSDINSAADSAFERAASVYSSTINMLIILIFILSTILFTLAKSMFSMKEQIEELQNR